jgi:5-methylcytosine-specific restriction endonuclease McrA
MPGAQGARRSLPTISSDLHRNRDSPSPFTRAPMPSRPAIHRPVGADATARAKARRDREREQLRPGSAERGYDDEWRVARKLHLMANPACVVPGCTRPATDVDHVVSIADAPDRRLDPTNFRSMCHQHHAQRTARDQGFAQSGPRNAVHGSPRAQRHPPWLGPSLVPLTVVCGPPGAGKSRLVLHRAHPRDLVLDLPEIAARLSGQPLYHATASFLEPALRYRNSRLKLCSIRKGWPGAWLVVAEAKAEWRAWWRDILKPVRVLVMEVQAETCIARIRADERRPDPVRRAHEEAVTQWWADYRRLDTDIILRDDERPTTGKALGA